MLLLLLHLAGNFTVGLDGQQRAGSSAVLPSAPVVSVSSSNQPSTQFSLLTGQGPHKSLLSTANPAPFSMTSSFSNQSSSMLPPSSNQGQATSIVALPGQSSVKPAQSFGTLPATSSKPASQPLLQLATGTPLQPALPSMPLSATDAAPPTSAKIEPLFGKTTFGQPTTSKPTITGSISVGLPLASNSSLSSGISFGKPIGQSTPMHGVPKMQLPAAVAAKASVQSDHLPAAAQSKVPVNSQMTFEPKFGKAYALCETNRRLLHWLNL